MVGGALGVAEHAASLHVKGRLFGNLASYIPQSVAQEIALNKPSDDIQAQRANVTVLAADVRNFSAYCEARSPEDTARVLHRFYKTANQIITKPAGRVQRFATLHRPSSTGIVCCAGNMGQMWRRTSQHQRSWP
jgi:adenylate cyclase